MWRSVMAKLAMGCLDFHYYFRNCISFKTGVDVEITMYVIHKYHWSLKDLDEPTHEILALFVLRKFILQIHMRSHPVGLDLWFLVWPFVYFHRSCVRTSKALARQCGCAGSPEPSLVAYAISTIISWACPSLQSRQLTTKALIRLRLCFDYFTLHNHQII